MSMKTAVLTMTIATVWLVALPATAQAHAVGDSVSSTGTLVAAADSNDDGWPWD